MMKYSHTLIVLSLSLLIKLIICATAEYDNNSTKDTRGDMSEQKTECPLWTKSTGNNTCICEYGYHVLVKCYSHGKGAAVTLPFCYCMSYNDLFNTTVIGYCIARCHVQNYGPTRKRITIGSLRYEILVNYTFNKSETNRALCSDLKMNRVGQMCGRCDEGYAPPVYSYSLNCVKCSDHDKFNWLKYIAVAYLPLTVFYALVILFRISATSARVSGYITTCQIVTSPTLLRYITVTVFSNSSNSYVTTIISKVVLTIYSIWNLDFFRLVYTPFCVDPNMSTFEILALDYVIAVYPLLLIVLTCIMVKLHDHYIVIVRLWRPFYKCFAFFRKEWDLKTSLVSAFASFILLSYIKILNISLDFLTPLTLFTTSGKRLTQRYLVVDGTVEYFGTEHLPFALIALVMCSLFNVFPLLLLCLYSCRCFHRCMNRLKLHSQVVHTFMDVFHGSFKTHPWDYRIFAAFYILLRIVNLLILSIFGVVLYFPFTALVMGLSAVVFAIAKPYKSSKANYFDMALLALVALSGYYVPVHSVVQNNALPIEYGLFNTVTFTVLSLHFLYGIGIFIVAFQPKMLRIFIAIIQKKCIDSIWNSAPPELRLPDRLVHPDDPAYAPLISRVQQTNKRYS